MSVVFCLLLPTFTQVCLLIRICAFFYLCYLSICAVLSIYLCCAVCFVTGPWGRCCAGNTTQNLKSAADAKEESLRDELLLKDKRLIAVQAKLYTVDEIMRVADTWRSISREVASNVIKACVAVQDLPPAPVPDPALMSDVFQGYAREAELNALRQQYQAKLKYYLALCQNHVAVNKELLARALRHSKVRSTRTVRINST
mmetsp:Transcript_2086/g.3294  ORF Transcript_2086/g.3294 Transcript_2086/m.3294 type:complete len:200 (-) Transcript_2086:385-984(-)